MPIKTIKPTAGRTADFALPEKKQKLCIDDEMRDTSSSLWFLRKSVYESRTKRRNSRWQGQDSNSYNGLDEVAKVKKETERTIERHKIVAA